MNDLYVYVWLFARQHICEYKPLISSTSSNSTLALLTMLKDEQRLANQVGAVGLYIKGPNGKFSSPNLL